jgi:hypothetical protein
MKHIIAFLLALAIIPSVLAVQPQTHNTAMQTTFITQGYSFARVQGINYNDAPVNVLNWRMTAELGALYASCEFQPVPLPPGPFDVRLTINCQTRSGFTTMYTPGTQVKIDTVVPDNTPGAGFQIEKVWVEAGPKLPTAFPLTGQAVRNAGNETNSTASWMFFAGMGAITAMTILVLLLSRRKEE